MALTKEDLEALKILAAEMRKPTEVEQAKIDEDASAKKAAMEERKENSANVKAQMVQKRNEQLTCSHQHADGHTHLAHVQENGKFASSAGYLLCQWCNAKVRPESAEGKKLDPQAIFDTALFNRLYQTLPNKEIFG